MIEELIRAIDREEDERSETIVNRLTPAHEPALLAMAGSADLDRAWWARRALARVGTEASLPTLLAGFTDPRDEIRGVSAMALGVLYPRAPKAVAPHLPKLLPLFTDEAGTVRQAAGDALAQCGKAGTDLLAEALESEHDGVRMRAAAALHRVGTMEVALPLYHHLNDANPLVRHYAYETLDALGLLENVLLQP